MSEVERIRNLLKEFPPEIHVEGLISNCIEPWLQRYEAIATRGATSPFTKSEGEVLNASKGFLTDDKGGGDDGEGEEELLQQLLFHLRLVRNCVALKPEATSAAAILCPREPQAAQDEASGENLDSQIPPEGRQESEPLKSLSSEEDPATARRQANPIEEAQVDRASEIINVPRDTRLLPQLAVLIVAMSRDSRRDLSGATPTPTAETERNTLRRQAMTAAAQLLANLAAAVATHPDLSHVLWRAVFPAALVALVDEDTPWGAACRSPVTMVLRSCCKASPAVARELMGLRNPEDGAAASAAAAAAMWASLLDPLVVSAAAGGSEEHTAENDWIGILLRDACLREGLLQPLVALIATHAEPPKWRRQHPAALDTLLWRLDTLAVALHCIDEEVEECNAVSAVHDLNEAVVHSPPTVGSNSRSEDSKEGVSPSRRETSTGAWYPAWCSSMSYLLDLALEFMQDWGIVSAFVREISWVQQVGPSAVAAMFSQWMIQHAANGFLSYPGPGTAEEERLVEERNSSERGTDGGAPAPHLFLHYAVEVAAKLKAEALASSTFHSDVAAAAAALILRPVKEAKQTKPPVPAATGNETSLPQVAVADASHASGAPLTPTMPCASTAALESPPVSCGGKDSATQSDECIACLRHFAGAVLRGYLGNDRSDSARGTNGQLTAPVMPSRSPPTAASCVPPPLLLELAEAWGAAESAPHGPTSLTAKGGNGRDVSRLQTGISRVLEAGMCVLRSFVERDDAGRGVVGIPLHLQGRFAGEDVAVGASGVSPPAGALVEEEIETLRKDPVEWLALGRPRLGGDSLLANTAAAKKAGSYVDSEDPSSSINHQHREGGAIRASKDHTIPATMSRDPLGLIGTCLCALHGLGPVLNPSERKVVESEATRDLLARDGEEGVDTCNDDSSKTKHLPSGEGDSSRRNGSGQDETVDSGSKRARKRLPKLAPELQAVVVSAGLARHRRFGGPCCLRCAGPHGKESEPASSGGEPPGPPPPLCLRHFPSGLPPHRLPYKGYRSDLMALLCNLAAGRPRSQATILRLDGVEMVLSQTVMDDNNPIAREFALMAVRNLCAGNLEVQRRIESLQLSQDAQSTVDTEDLARMGLRLQMNSASGKIKLVQTEEAAAMAARQAQRGP